MNARKSKQDAPVVRAETKRTPLGRSDMRRMMLITLSLAAAACGSPFEATTHEPHGDAALSEASVEPETGTEGGHREASVKHEAGADAPPPPVDAGDAGTDSPVVVDAGHDAGHDAPPPPPVDAGCTPFVAKAPPVCSMGSAPGTFCTFFEISSSYLATVTPPECQCAETFTCACLYAHGVDTAAFCTASTPPVKCTDNANSGPTVECP